MVGRYKGIVSYDPQIPAKYVSVAVGQVVKDAIEFADAELLR